jgi:hypothetical protein
MSCIAAKILCCFLDVTNVVLWSFKECFKYFGPSFPKRNWSPTVLLSYQKCGIFLYYQVYFHLVEIHKRVLCLAKLHTFLTSALDGGEGVRFTGQLLLWGRDSFLAGNLNTDSLADKVV